MSKFEYLTTIFSTHDPQGNRINVGQRSGYPIPKPRMSCIASRDAEAGDLLHQIPGTLLQGRGSGISLFSDSGVLSLPQPDGGTW